MSAGATQSEYKPARAIARYNFNSCGSIQATLYAHKMAEQRRRETKLFTKNIRRKRRVQLRVMSHKRRMKSE